MQLAWQTGGSGALLATTGADGTVAIYNRKGQLHERIILNGYANSNLIIHDKFQSNIVSGHVQDLAGIAMEICLE